MLRASIDTTDQQLDFSAIVNRFRDAGADSANEIIAFTHALVTRTAELETTRDALVHQVGPVAAAAVAGSVGNFEMMNRLLDATGVPTPGTMEELTRRLQSP